MGIIYWGMDVACPPTCGELRQTSKNTTYGQTPAFVGTDLVHTGINHLCVACLSIHSSLTQSLLLIEGELGPSHGLQNLCGVLARERRRSAEQDVPRATLPGYDFLGGTPSEVAG